MTSRPTQRSRTKNRSESGSFLSIPHAVLRSSNYVSLSSHAIKLLLDLGTQYNGKNNGDLCATWSMMQLRGWKSQDTLHRAIKQLISKGMIVKSRQGGRHLPSLYALSWKGIDDCGGKLEILSTPVPPGNWKSNQTLTSY